MLNFRFRPEGDLQTFGKRTFTLTVTGVLWWVGFG
jgi:hypothetical protein